MIFEKLNSINLMLGGEKPSVLNNDFKWGAVDSGLNYLIENKILPIYVFGDFDSLNSEYKKLKGIRFVKKDNQDQTDTEFALNSLISKHPELKLINIYGATGLRQDHFFANIMLLSNKNYNEVDIRIIDDHNQIIRLEKGRHILKKNNLYRYISLVPLRENTYISICGSKYDVDNYLLSLDRANATSNEFLEEEIVLYLNKESLLIYSKD